MKERNIKLVVEYDGTAYAGWQIQPGQSTIQGQLTQAIKNVTGQDVKVIGAGRTDAGVHAIGQVANFRIQHSLPGERFAPAVNYYLAPDIRVQTSVDVPWEFHARFDALSKRYRYLIGPAGSALYRHRRWCQTGALDFEKLTAAAGMLLGEHDFAPFCVVSSLKEDNRCRIEHSRWFRLGPLLIFEIRGNRFLHNMVRSLVGGMVNLATNRPTDNIQNLTLESFQDIIKSPEGQRVVFTAPAAGLYLVSVKYREGKSQ
ncbi:MAG: tRNA pseudouridine(38-40) synthase TruA [bacterium]